MIGVLQEDHSISGGVESVTRRLVESFLFFNKGIRVYSCNEKDNTKKEAYDIRILNINIFGKEEICNFIKILEMDKIDKLIIQLNGPYSKLANKNLLKSIYNSGIKIYVVIHNSPKSFITIYKNRLDNIVIRIIKFFRMKLYLILKYKNVFKTANKYVKFVTLSEGNQKELIDYYGIKSVIIPNFYDIEVKKSIESKKHSLAYIGRFDFYQKNILFLLDAWNCVENKRDWFFYIIGDNSEKSRTILIDYINKHNISNIKLIGEIKRDEVNSFLGENSIFLLGSKFEGFPTVVLEAEVNENIVISTKYDGYSDEILKNKINGFVLPENEKIFADAIQQLIDNPTLYKEFQFNNKKIVNEYLTHNNIISKWEMLLGE